SLGRRTTDIHVPSIGLVVAGDVVYNGVYSYLFESADSGREKWLSALDIVERLAPRHLVADTSGRSGGDRGNSAVHPRSRPAPQGEGKPHQVFRGYVFS